MKNINLKEMKYIKMPFKIMTDYNINDTQKFILSIFYTIGENNIYSITNNEFSDFLGVSKNRISRLISDLEKKGYIERKIIYKDNSKEIKDRILCLKK